MTALKSDPMEKLIEIIVSNLQKNGFPSKKVSFPRNSLENFIRKYDYDLDDVLDEMRQNDIFSRPEGQKIVFSPEDFSKTDFSALKNMSPEDIKKYMDIYEKMSPEEKQRLHETARQMGLF